MSRAAAAACVLLLAGRAAAAETLGVLAIADPPGGPDVDLAELAHQLRAACRDRVGGVEDVPTMRARLLGQGSNATVSELDRAYGGALAVYQNGEFDSAVRTLRAIVDDLEALPETDESYAQWVRAQFRLAHAALTIGLDREADGAFFALARTDIALQADPDQYSPTYRRRFEQVKAKVRALPARRLTVSGEGAPGTVFVNGRRVGTTPLAMWLPAGRYRVGGAAGALRVPSVAVDLEHEDRSILLDFALADSLRVNSGPGLALAPARRGDGIVRAGAWLGADRIIAVSRVHEGEAQFLLGSIYDVRRGALLREGSVRMVAGTVPSVNLAALASFLLTGQSSRDVKDRTAAARVAPLAAAGGRGPASAAAARESAATAAASTPASAPDASAAPPSGHDASASGAARGVRDPAALVPGARATAVAEKAPAKILERADAAAPPGPTADVAARPQLAATGTSAPEAGMKPSSPPDRPEPTGPRRWMRRGAIASGVLAGGFTAVAVQQAFAARRAYGDADAMVAPGGVLLPGSDPSRYRDLRRDGDASARNAYLSAGAAAAFAAAAGVLGWTSRDRSPDAPLAVRF